ncbi:hypothetical protein DSM3645_26324 [Blastopirellula marina DSM 3645]|uniref:Uncharacterized protein n=1 Tax=Blastopirellula marina DSM 3645 TaxID=314230 RepID=A3ZWH8_9BACT|nr:hypothetical protein DSM3645_26324 [Blastopirellula marina DSM 3645]
MRRRLRGESLAEKSEPPSEFAV